MARIDQTLGRVVQALCLATQRIIELEVLAVDKVPIFEFARTALICCSGRSRMAFPSGVQLPTAERVLINKLGKMLQLNRPHPPKIQKDCVPTLKDRGL